jgi:hypothetical protein
VHGIDKDVTKTGEDRRIELSPRAIAVLERQLRLRERWVQQEGHIQHRYLFFTNTGEPIRALASPYARWRRTLRRLAIRYRKPYAARRTSVSWNLMLGRNPLWVARQLGHSIATMLWVYAAWIDGTWEADLCALRESVHGRPGTSPRSPELTLGNTPTDSKDGMPKPADATARFARGILHDLWTPCGFGTGFATGRAPPTRKPLNQGHTSGGEGGIAAAVLAAGPSGPTREARRQKSLPTILSNPLVLWHVASNPTPLRGSISAGRQRPVVRSQ